MIAIFKKTLATLVIFCSASSSLASDIEVVDISISVLPIASLEFIGDSTLKLTVPPSGSTVPSDGVNFRVIGNASASLTAEPDEFIEVNSQFLGAASKSGERLGYNIELRFPSVGVAGSPRAFATLPGFEAGPTVPELSADLTLTNMERLGEIHLEADPFWTNHGGLPLPGLYEGSVTLTIVAY